MTTTQQDTLDLEPMVRTLKVLDKQKRLIPFEPNWAQRELLAAIKEDYEAGKPVRFIILKARQIGISTLIESVIFLVATMFPNTEAVIASLDTEQAEYLFDMTKRFYDEWAFKELFPPRYDSKRQLFLRGVESDINVKTGENPKSFRGRTYTAAHISEIAFWSKPVEAMLAIDQGMPERKGNFKFVESTANGMGNQFESEWNNAVKGKSDYRPFFFPWFKHYEYIPCQGEECRDGSCAICSRAARQLDKLDAEERTLLKMGATKAHLAWRRKAIVNLCQGSIDLFHQEYPATPKEAFLAKGVNAFNIDDLDAVFKPEEPDIGKFVVSKGEVEFVVDPDGGWRIYRYPSIQESGGSRWGEYFIGGDPSYGSMDGDFAAAQVISRRTKEQVAVFQGKILPGPFADELAMAGKFYNLAPVAPETEGGGLATIERLRHIYPRVYQRRVFDVVPGEDRSERTEGWSTNWKTKAMLITKGAEVVQRHGCIFHDEATYEEMRTYVFYAAKGLADRFGPADTEKGRDDLVMSWCIAIVCEAQEGPLSAYEVADPPGVVYAVKDDGEGEEEWR